MKITKTQTGSYKKLLVAVTILATALLGVWAGYTYVYDKPINAVDESPATEDDKRLNDQHKQDLPTTQDENQTPEPPTSTVNKKAVTPVISAWGQPPTGSGTDFRLNGFVDGIIESDGKCTLTLTKDGSTAIVTKGALRNAQNTSCGQLVIPYSELTPGTWQAVLIYSSPTSEGNSAQTAVEVK